MIRHELEIPAHMQYETLGKEQHMAVVEGVGHTYRAALIDAGERIHAELKALDASALDR